METVFLKNLWEDREAARLEANPLELLRYRSNLLGADLRITNFGGGNTSSKFTLPDPLTGKAERVMAVKGSGGDLRSIGTAGFAVLYLDKLESLIQRYRGEAFEDEMVGFYPLSAFGENRVAASIDTPLHAFLPFPHVDHLHPDWAIALAASANGGKKLEEFNQKYSRHIVWVPWQRPGFELALMLRQAVEAQPGCDGIILGGHGLFTWGESQRECYLNSIKTIDQMGEFVQDHQKRLGRPLFGGSAAAVVREREDVVAALLPYLRGAVSSNRRVIAHYDSSEDALTFASSQWADDLCSMGTSCPDHFLRTRISPMFIPWNAESEGIAELKKRIDERLVTYRRVRRVLQRARRCGLTGAARLESIRRRDPGPWSVRVRQGQARSSHYVRVLRECDPRHGRRQRARGARGGGDVAASGAASGPGRGIPELPQLRRAAALGGVSHRILGARRGKAAAHAAGARIQPQGRGRCRRRERNRPGSRAADRATGRTGCRRGHERRERRGSGERRGCRVIAGHGAGGCRRSRVARQHRRGMPRDGHALRWHRRGRQHRRNLPHPGRRNPGGRRLGAYAQHQRDEQLRAR